MNTQERFYTYLYSDPSRGMEPIYVGKGTGQRFKTHLRRIDHHPLTYRLRKMRLVGVEPVITFLCKDVDEELACLVEVEAIAKYGRKDLGRGPLLNKADGGGGSTNPTPEMLALRGKKISVAKKAAGKTYSAEERQRISVGKKLSNAQRGFRGHRFPKGSVPHNKVPESVLKQVLDLRSRGLGYDAISECVGKSANACVKIFAKSKLLTTN